MMLRKILFFLCTGGGVMLACSNGPTPVVQSALVSIVQGGAQAPQALCNRSGDFLDLGKDPDKSTYQVVENSATSQVVCSIIPSAGNYQVQISVTNTTGTSPSVVTFSGVFQPRDPNNANQKITGIRGDFQDATIHLVQTDCYAQYTTADAATLTGAALPSVADTFADDKGGRIWASVFCPNATNVKTDNQLTKACQATATFVFENCASKAQ